MFRSRTLDNKRLPVLWAKDVPELHNFTAIRPVPQMPTGMQKGEEREHHLQQAISAQKAFGSDTGGYVIPTPGVVRISDEEYDHLYPANFKEPCEYIRTELPPFAQSLPEYDMDSEDEAWLNPATQQYLNIDETKFEQMIEFLEKSSSRQKVINLAEAKAFLKGIDESAVISVYDYWLNKKLNVGRSLMPKVKTGNVSSVKDPYIAFRRLAETRSRRSTDRNSQTATSSDAKALRRFQQNLIAARNLVDMVRRREELKYEAMKCQLEIFKERLRLGDCSSRMYDEAVTAASEEEKASKKQASNKSVSLLATQNKKPSITKMDTNALPQRKIAYKRTPKWEIAMLAEVDDSANSESENALNGIIDQDEWNGPVCSPKETAEHSDDPFEFKRKKGCNYLAPRDDQLWESPDEGVLRKPQFRFNLTSLSHPSIPIGYARRRIGRGGRIIFDRAYTDLYDDEPDWENIESKWPHFRAVSPVDEDRAIDNVDSSLLPNNLECYEEGTLRCSNSL